MNYISLISVGSVLSGGYYLQRKKSLEYYNNKGFHLHTDLI